MRFDGVEDAFDGGGVGGVEEFGSGRRTGRACLREVAAIQRTSRRRLLYVAASFQPAVTAFARDDGTSPAGRRRYRAGIGGWAAGLSAIAAARVVMACASEAKALGSRAGDRCALVRRGLLGGGEKKSASRRSRSASWAVAARAASGVAKVSR